MKRFNGHITCDHCVKICNYYGDDFIGLRSKKKNTEMYFCNERCMLVFFKGKKYYQRKLKAMIDNKVITDQGDTHERILQA